MKTTRNVYNYTNKRISSMNYLLSLPEDNSAESLGLIVMLHGAGERGVNVANVYRHGIPELVAEGREIPAILLFPQCPAWAVWDNVVDRVKGLIDSIAKDFSVDMSRITITGSSMGGYGSFAMGLSYPNFFAGIAPVAGGGMSWRAGRLRKTPVLAIYGEKDGAVPFVCSELMVNNLKNAGGNVEFISLKNFDHNDGIDFAYRSTKLISWLLAQKRTSFDYVPDICEDCF